MSAVMVFLFTLGDYIIMLKKRLLGKNIHNEALTKVMLAPINNFFNVTPLGTILKRFREDMSVFRERLLDAPIFMSDMGSHFFHMFFLWAAVGSYLGIIGTAVIFYGVYLVAKPFVSADNQLWR